MQECARAYGLEVSDSLCDVTRARVNEVWYWELLNAGAESRRKMQREFVTSFEGSLCRKPRCRTMNINNSKISQQP